MDSFNSFHKSIKKLKFSTFFVTSANFKAPKELFLWYKFDPREHVGALFKRSKAKISNKSFEPHPPYVFLKTSFFHQELSKINETRTKKVIRPRNTYKSPGQVTTTSK